MIHNRSRSAYSLAKGERRAFTLKSKRRVLEQEKRRIIVSDSTKRASWVGAVAATLTLAVFAQQGDAAKLGKMPSPEQIQAVAKMLPAEPVGVGRPVSDREAWGKLAKHPTYAKVVPTAVKLIGKPLPAPTPAAAPPARSTRPSAD